MAFPRSSFSQATGQVERGTGRRFGREVDAKFGGYLNSLVHPELSLGYGLGYTTFAYSAPEISKGELSVRSGTARVTVEVANTGSRPGRDIVQLYVRDLVATIARPVVELADWRAIELEPGASTKVTFKITAQTFGYYDSEMSWRTDPGDVDVIVGPNAALGQSARLTLVE